MARAEGRVAPAGVATPSPYAATAKRISVCPVLPQSGLAALLPVPSADRNGTGVVGIVGGRGGGGGNVGPIGPPLNSCRGSSFSNAAREPKDDRACLLMVHLRSRDR